MPTPFATLEARINTAVFAHLANASADFGGGVVVDGIFRKPFAGSFGNLIGDDAPMFEAPSASLPTVTPGTTALTIAAVSYTVARVEPDGTGLTAIILKATPPGGFSDGFDGGMN